MNLNKDAWNNLDLHERTALSLKHISDKSSWQAGEIMSRSHYKYLEIKSRAEHFLKLFTEYYNLFGCLIPDEVTGDMTVIEYFKLTIIKRYKPKKAIDTINEKRPNGIMRGQLNIRIEKQLKAWGRSQILEEIKVYNLIQDFDRWNNFRILPKSCQEPSAFKRRLKNVFKKQLKVLKDLNEFSLDHLKKLLRATRQKDREKALYLPLLEKNGSLKVYLIKNKPTYLEILSDMGLYYFIKVEDAKDYMALVAKYLLNQKRSCKDGLDFWPQFREQIKKAANYDKVCNKAPHRRQLEVAMSKLEYI